MKKTPTPKKSIFPKVKTQIPSPDPKTNKINDQYEVGESLRQSEYRYRELFENSLMAISIVDLEGFLIQANAAYARMYGYENAQEMITSGINVGQFYANRDKRNEVIDILKKYEKMEPCEIEVVRRDGTHFFVLVSASVIKDETGKIIHYQANHIDITERKNLEKDLNENETLFTTLFHSSPIPISLSEIDTENWIEVNEAFLKVTGYSRHEVIGRSFRDINLWKNIADREKMRSLLKSQGYIKSFEVEINKKDGTNGTMLISVEIVKISDKPCMLISGDEITERKKIEEELKENSEKFNLFLQYSPVYTYIKEVTPTESRVVVASKNFAEMIGKKAIDMVGKTMYELFPAEFAAKMTADDWKVILNEKVLTLEENLNNRNYTSIKFPIKLGGKNLLAGYTMDITEQKQAEEDLKQSKDHYRLLFDSSPDGITHIGLDGKFEMVNLAHAKIYGYNSPEEMIGLHATKMVALSSREYSAQIMQRRLNGEEIPPVEYKLVRKDGTIFYGEVKATLLRKTDGTINGYICVTHETTERKLAEERIKLSEEKFRNLFNNAEVGMYRTRLDGSEIIEFNKKYLQILGYDPDEVKGKPSVNIWADKNERDKMLERLKADGYVYDLEFDILTKKGEVRRCITSLKLYRDTQILEGSILDITERKQAEEAIKLNEARLKRAELASLSGNWELHLDTKTIISSEGLRNVYGVDKDYIGYEEIKKFTLPEYRPILDKALKKLIEHNKPYNLDFKINKANAGEIRDIHSEATFDKDRKIVFGIIQDITDRKIAEATLNDIIEKNPMSIQIVDINGHTLKTNPANTLLFGSPPPPDFSIFGDLQTRYPHVKKHIELAKSGQVVHLPDILYNTHDISPELPDNPKWIRAIIFPLKDSAGKPDRFVFMHEDITERKLAEEALKDSESKYQFIVENTDDLLWTMNADLKFEYISPSVTKLMGYTVDEHIKHTLDDFLTPESAQMIKEEFKNGMINLQKKEYHKLRDRADYELEFIRKDKTQGYGFTSMIIVRDEQYQLKKIRGRTFDITERKLIEKYNALGREVLQILNEPYDWAKSIQKVITILKEGTKFDAVGIRLQVKDDYLYYANQGFSKEFLKTENTLQGKTSEGLICKDKEGNIKLECTCGLVISGKTDPSLPFFTVGGSFWINDSSMILNIPPDKDPRFQPRNICVHEGYRSFALIPIRNSERIVGLIQLNDKCKDRFTLNTIQLFEGIASHIGTALMRKQAEEALQIKMDELMRFHKLTVGRELKMIELKKEINALLKQLGMEEKYNIVDEKDK